MTVCRHLIENLKSENITKNEQISIKKIIFVWNYLEWGGAQIYFLGIARRIKNLSDVLFIFPKDTGRQFFDFCENSNIPYEVLEVNNDLKPANTIKRKLERHFNKIRSETAMLKFLQKFDLKDSILHIELAPWQSVFSLIRLCWRANVFITMHNRLPQVSKWRFLLWKLKFALITQFKTFHLFASNKDAKNSLEPFVSSEFLKKVCVTYTNVNPDEVEEALNSKLQTDKLKDKFKLPKDKFLVFCVGQFIDRKGRWTFLEAAKILKEKSAEIVFVWISNSNLTDEEQSKINSFELGDNFFLVKSDEVGREHLELMKFLRIADAYTLPSFVEGLPISLLEAMAMGVPSISTNINAIPEAVKNLETGILIEAGESNELAEAIELLKNDKKLREKLGKNGREWVLANFNEKSVAEIAFQNYRKALNQAYSENK